MKHQLEIPPVRILIVDDKVENLMALESVLTDCDYQLFKALSGKEALALVNEFEFAAILLDVQMPMMNGYDVAKSIRKEFPVTPILFVTANYPSENDERLGYIAGAVDYLYKPINSDILRAKLAIFAELFRRHKENEMQTELLKEAAFREQENLLLKEAVQVRDEFLSMASHELKTPITPLNLQMQAFIHLFEEGRLEHVPRATLLRLLRTSQAQIDRLSKLVNELVEVSSMKMGKLNLKAEKTDLGELVSDIVLSYSEEFQRADCTMRLSCEPEVIGYWDRVRLEQIVSNLLTNAIKYAAGKLVEIRTHQKDGTAYIVVRDQGIGIAKEDQERIFDKFERAVSPTNYSGLGLGLYIAFSMAKLHGGDIKIQSELGKGATFEVSLPIGEG